MQKPKYTVSYSGGPASEDIHHTKIVTSKGVESPEKSIQISVTVALGVCFTLLLMSNVKFLQCHTQVSTKLVARL